MNNVPDSIPVKLLLSGGGFRATLFHLGVIRYLLESEKLRNIQEIYSVSGGSILAAYMGLNWKAITDRESFAATAVPLLDYIASDVRGRIVRRRLTYLSMMAAVCALASSALMLPTAQPIRLAILATSCVILTIQFFCFARWYSLSALFERDLASFINPLQRTSATRQDAQLRMLTKPESDLRPKFFFIATDLTTGKPWIFTESGIWIRDEQWKHLRLETLPISTAVAASAAFPPLFRPIRIARRVAPELLQTDHFLSDGGVYDNLGVDTAQNFSGRPVATDSYLQVELHAPADIFIASDAENRFNAQPGSYSLLINRAIRSTDILMSRCSRFSLSAVSNEKILHVPLARDQDEAATSLPVSLQRKIRSIRTDLDRFTRAEMQLLVFKGYIAAWEKLDGSALPLQDFSYSAQCVPDGVKNPDRWLPFSGSELGSLERDDELLSGTDASTLRLLDWADKHGSIALIASVLVILLVNPVTLGIAQFAKGFASAQPSNIPGDWYGPGENMGKGFEDIEKFLRQGLESSNPGLKSPWLFRSHKLEKIYGWGPTGSFDFSIATEGPYKLLRPAAILVAEGSRMIPLLDHGADDSFTYTIPDRSGEFFIAISLTIVPSGDSAERITSIPPPEQVVRLRVISAN